MFVRQAQPTDVDSIHATHLAAFEQPAEADLARALLDGHHVPSELSLVAEIDGSVVGHVVCSRGHIGQRVVMGLGPIGVAPDSQGAGVGSALMHAVLGAADAMAEPMVVLLGAPDYYSRFGFVPSSELGVEPPDPTWGHFFQARALHNHDPSLTGRYEYAPPFNAVG